ncbi:hypothetical protein MB46_10880 [Arthrobacter alpinus]|uniref:hypothetical protein n=1 Tax=Arthrobacter alpinus TaxID=656366 RepID=UPI0005C9E47D|nr:hypothetical protein [Arthrobacter alpinus]ALV45913.1 hypothetical protein MB46_10880 [Arthrobacter alpinus]
MKDASANNSAERGPLTASGPTASPSWNILKKCLRVAGAAVVIMVVLAFIFTDVQGVLSVLFGALLVIVFFGLSLLVGHIVGKKMPSAVMGVFVMTYFVKVVGFAAVLYAMGTPGWLNKPWFAGAAVATVLLWQATEVVNFTKQRFLVFDESAAQPPTTGGTAADGEKKGTLP